MKTTTSISAKSGSVVVEIDSSNAFQIRFGMKIIMMAASTLLLTACAPQSDKPRPVGMANPASVYCEKVGGKLDIVKGPNGESGYCTLPGGERIEEWTLYRRDKQ